MIEVIRNSARLVRILWVLGRQGAGLSLEAMALPIWVVWLFKCVGRTPKQGERPGAALAQALVSLGPAYIKLGQALSIRSDIVGDEIAQDLANLRDKLPPFPTSIARAIIESELGGKLENFFASFSEEPIAAASIAQVHAAHTHDGRKVAVKILRPNIAKAFERDIALFTWLAALIERRLPNTKRLKPREVVSTLKDSIFFELDLRFEAASAEELKHNVQPEDGFYVPAIEWELTSQRVLTLEWMEGLSIVDIESLEAAGHNPTEIMSKAAIGFFNMVYRDGFFHADLHPGNMFVLRDGRIAVVDFGIMGRIDNDNRRYLAEILRGFLTEDYRHVARVHFEAGYVPAGKSLDNFTLACMAVGKPVLGKPMSQISFASLLGQMFKIAGNFEMEVQPQLLLLQKTMMMVEGIGRTLNPNVNMWQLAEPLVEAWAKKHIGPRAQIERIAKEGLELFNGLPRTVKQLQNVLTKLESNSLEITDPSRARQAVQQWTMQRGWLWLGWAALILLSIEMWLSR